MNKIEIDVPKGHKAVQTTDKKGNINIVFTPIKSIIERITNFYDILDELGIDESGLPYKNIPQTDTKEETNFKRSINAFWRLSKIALVYNEGTVLDWKNTSQYKYLPYKHSSGGSWVVFSVGWFAHCLSSAGVYFKSKELSEDAYEKFKDIYEDFWNIN
jgi:hypothetical protein